MNTRSKLAIATVAVVTALAGAPDSSAQSLDDAVAALLDRRARDLAGTVAKRALRRGRRAFALGPLIGAGPVLSTEGDLDAQISGGLALVRYDISIFISADQIAEMIKSRVQRLLLERFAGGRAPTEADVERLIGEVIDDIKAELQMQLSPRRFERPRFKLSLEVDRQIDAAAWELRGTLGFGLSRVFLATGLVGRFDDGAALVVPIEIGVPMLLSDGLRSPAIEWLARIDVAVTDRDARSDQLMLGARLMLDII